jgi:hypothetical protein
MRNPDQWVSSAAVYGTHLCVAERGEPKKHLLTPQTHHGAPYEAGGGIPGGQRMPSLSERQPPGR